MIKPTENYIEKYKFYVIVLLAIIFFIFLSILFSHPDLSIMYIVSEWLTNGQINIYKILDQSRTTCNWLSAPNPPLFYETIGSYLFLLRKVGLLSQDLFIDTCPAVWSLLNNRQFLFFAKLPYLLSHLISSYLFCCFFNSKRRFWFLFWLLNPLSIFVNFIFGQYESVAVLFFLGSLLSVKNNRTNLSFLLLGISGALKHFPFMLLPIFLFYFKGGISKKIKWLSLAVLPYFLSVIPVFGQSFLNNVLLFDENRRMLAIGFNLGFGYTLYPYVILYIFIILHYLFSNKDKGFHSFLKYSLLVLSLFFILSLWTPQWFMFLLPFLIFSIAVYRDSFALYEIFITSVLISVLVLFPGVFDHAMLRNSVENLHLSSNLLYTISALTGLSPDIVKGSFISLIAGQLAFINYFTFFRKKIEVAKIETNIKYLFLILIPLLIYLSLILIYA